MNLLVALHTFNLDFEACEGVILFGPRTFEKHWGEGGLVRICSTLSSLLCRTFSKSREIGMFSLSAAVLLHQTWYKLIIGIGSSMFKFGGVLYQRLKIKMGIPILSSNGLGT